MAVKNEKFLIQTKGFNDIIDITLKVSDVIKNSAQIHDVKNGVVHIFVQGSTAALTTLEYEPGLIKDIPEILDELIPKNRGYKHDKTWHDGNGSAHIRASFLGSSVTIPYVNGEMELGQWQQIVLIDFDNKPRTRSVIVQVIY